jgi:hypothetical protein
MREVSAEVPQFSSPRLDASFLINCGRLLTGKLETTEGAPGTYIKRVAGSDFRSAKAMVLYECSTELLGMLAALTAERVAEMGAEWYSMYGPSKSKSAEANGRTHTQLAIINNLAELAKQAKGCESVLMLRVDYRKQH